MKRKLLLVYPEFSPTYWGMQYKLPLINRKAFMPPIGLVTIAAMCPPDYEFRLVDLNCRPLTQEDIDWADVVLFSAMLPQKLTLFQAAKKVKDAGKLVIFGGPYPTACSEECALHCDVLVLNEGEVTWPRFLEDFEQGSYQRIYTDETKPDVTQSPCPRFDLFNVPDYVLIPLQFSRGCPFQCEFCDIIVMFGRRPRTKTPAQFLRELDAVYRTGYRGNIFIVDDNFIGNKKEVKMLLPAIQEWNRAHGYPFAYATEASVNLADDPDLMKAMTDTNFFDVFLGLETPSMESLRETKKYQNTKGSLVDSVRAIQEAGLVVSGGFIIGFDHDTEDIFDRQLQFIHEAGIPNAMVGPLTALPGTPLYHRLEKEGRLARHEDDGHNRTVASFGTNIDTRIPYRTLLEGYRRILESIYNPEAYFERLLETMCRLPRPNGIRKKMQYLLWTMLTYLRQMAGNQSSASTWAGIRCFRKAWSSLPEEFRSKVRKFMRDIVKKRPERMAIAFVYVLMEYHYHKFTVDYMLPQIDNALEQIKASGARRSSKKRAGDLRGYERPAACAEGGLRAGRVIHVDRPRRSPARGQTKVTSGASQGTQ